MPTLPARLRALAAVWLAFKILSGTPAQLQSEPAPPSRSHAQLPEASFQRFEFHEPHMGTDTRIVVYALAREERAVGDAVRAAFDRVEALNAVLSDYQPTSELMRLSAGAGVHASGGAGAQADGGAAQADGGGAGAAAASIATVPSRAAASVPARANAIAVSEDLFRVLAASQDIALRSGGAFDVTCGALTRLWRRARHLSELPSAARVEEARALTGYRAMQLDPRARTVTLATPGMSLDVGGIAKGYAAEEALNILATRGLRRALVALGGDIAVGDPPPDHDGWLVDVATVDDTPNATDMANAAPAANAADGTRASRRAAPTPAGPGPIALRNASISTAGDAEQWMTVNGVRYSHILDPRTGWPMTIRSSTTVIAPHGLDADGLDDAAALLGPDRGVALIEATPGAAVYMARIEADGRVNVRTSSRWPPRARVNQTAHRDVEEEGDAPQTSAATIAVVPSATPPDETLSARPR